MAEITAAAVKALRERTDLPMMDCKKALVEADGDAEKAVEILKSQHKKIMDKRSDNVTAEGCIAYAISDDCSAGAMVELQCESAPVAANDEFIGLANQCASQLLNGPGAGSTDELLDQTPDGSDATLRQTWEELVNKIREKIVLAKVLKVDGPVAGYVHHDGKTGVLFQASGESSNADILRDVAMHIAALKPTVVAESELDQADVEAERARLSDEAKATGKPENIIEKIVDGRMKNFYVDQGVLLHQAFAKEDTKTVSQVLAENGYTAVGFTRWILGG
ncbi:MAG: translation elongation factor Ts [Planctomycetaceae bacterium]|nr:translation elongation factor Ts [Planctomycetaceae bacterium]